MKSKIQLMLSFLLVALSSLSQTKHVTPGALKKMFTDYYNYVLVGSQTPTSGFKVETAKPTITLKGNIHMSKHRRFVTNMELEGGVDNGIMQLISGKNVSGYFKGSLGFNFLLKKNKASRYKLSETEMNLTENAFQNNRVALAKQLDTFAVIKTIIDDMNFEIYSFKVAAAAIKKERNLKKYKLNNMATDTRSDTAYENLLRNILIYYGTKADDNNEKLLDNFDTAAADKSNSLIQSKKMLQDYDRIKDNLLKDELTLNDKQYDFELALTKVNWTKKNIRWVNISASGNNSNFKLFNTSDNSILDTNSLLPSLSASFNWLSKSKEPNKFTYFKTGITLQKMNNLSELQKFNYKKETVISVAPGEELKSTKEGTAYQGALNEKFGFDIFFEGYAVPWKQDFIPGFYFKSVFRNSKAFINKNKLLVDLGMIWNVTSSDKDAKNLLTIVPYISWSNVLKEYKNVTKTEKKNLSDLFSMNVKFAIPINLGK